MGVPRAITVLRDRYGAAPRGKLRELISKYGVSRRNHLAPWTLQSWKLSENQLAMVDIIEDEALKAGLTLPAAAAMVANSWAESGLNKDIVQKGVAEPGVGLFQLTGSPAKNPAKGSYEQRKDPVFNTRYMLSRSEMQGGFGVAFRKAMLEGAGVDSLASIFARDIERCALCSLAWANGTRLKYKDQGSSELVGPSGRAALARLLFPTMPHTGDINPQVEAKPHHGGAWSTSKPPEITYTPAPVPEKPLYTPPVPAPVTTPAPVTSAPTVVAPLVVAPIPPAVESEPPTQESAPVAPVGPLSLTTNQLVSIGLAAAVASTFIGVMIVRNRRPASSAPLSYTGAR